MSHVNHSSLTPDACDADVVVVGGGLAGLISSVLVSRRGHRVILLDRSSHVGGRAITTEKSGIHLNLGPHALYCAGDTFRILQELDVPFTGNFPPAQGSFLSVAGELHPIPRTLASVLRSRLFSVWEKVKLIRFFQQIGHVNPRAIDHVPFREWLERMVGRGSLADVLATLFRVTTFITDHHLLSAGAAVEQFQIGLKGNVWYLDGGWQTLINGLTQAARREGVQIQEGAPVRHVTSHDGRVETHLASGKVLRSTLAIVATEPDAAGRLLNLPTDHPISHWQASRRPVHMASLDLALRSLPRPDVKVVFQVDQPFYYSVHSAVANLAPDAIQVIHVAKYLRTDETTGPVLLRKELEDYLDQLQPGWRADVVTERFLPSMMVSGALPLAAQAGYAGRPDSHVAGMPGILLAGDWVGPSGLLADASAASAERAAAAVESLLHRRKAELISGSLQDATH